MSSTVVEDKNKFHNIIRDTEEGLGEVTTSEFQAETRYVNSAGSTII